MLIKQVHMFSKIADHCILEIVTPFPAMETTRITREVWLFKSAKWDRLNKILNNIDWGSLRNQDPDEGVEKFSEIILEAAKTCIKRKPIGETESSHPWMNDRVVQAVDAKR